MVAAIIRFFKSLLVFLIVGVVTLIPCLIFGLFFSPTGCYILGSILGAVFTVIFYGFAGGFKWEFFYTDDDHSKKAWKANLPLFFHVLFAGGAVAFMALGKPLMNHLQKENPAISIVCILIGVFLVTQLAFWVALRIYHGEETCPHCKYIYSLGYNSHIGTEVTKERQYKTETEKKEVGGIYAGSTKIGTINADVSNDYVREVTRTISTDCYICSHCGQKVEIKKGETNYSKWS